MANHSKHQQEREALWANVWIGVARSTNADDAKVATQWADRALHDFDARFNPDTGTLREPPAPPEKKVKA